MKSRKREISQNQINKVTSFLNDVNKNIHMHGGKSKSHELATKHRLTPGYFVAATQIGYFTKVSHAIHKSNVANFEPIHARKVILKANQRKYGQTNKIEKDAPLKKTYKRKSKETNGLMDIVTAMVQKLTKSEKYQLIKTLLNL